MVVMARAVVHPNTHTDCAIAAAPTRDDQLGGEIDGRRGR